MFPLIMMILRSISIRRTEPIFEVCRHKFYILHFTSHILVMHENTNTRNTELGILEFKKNASEKH